MKYKKENIFTLKEVADFLTVPVPNLVYLSNNMHKNIRESKKLKKGSLTDMRTITAPSKNLKAVLRLVKSQILSTYSFRSYVYGLGGNTLKQHASIHEGNKEIIQVDLTDFYPSIKHDMVYKMWIEVFEISPEAARILTRITTMGGGLKQGFPTSSHIAGIVAEEFTSSIDDYCGTNNLKFTQYVDDLNISGIDVDLRMVFKTIISLGRVHRLTIKRKKTKVNSRLDGKTITGVALFNQQTRATKEVRNRAVGALRDLASSPKDEHYRNRASGYLGFLKHLNRRDGNRYAKLRDDIINSKIN